MRTWASPCSTKRCSCYCHTLRLPNSSLRRYAVWRLRREAWSASQLVLRSSVGDSTVLSRGCSCSMKLCRGAAAVLM
jgi:hypothetical protein